ncbi:MAG: hypothetical protein ACLFM9_04375 [Candidatus Aenigmatarchaeota archaeon]
MNKTAAVLLALLLVVGVSGCMGFATDVDLAGILGVGEPEYIVTEKVSVSAESLRDEVEVGRKTRLQFEIENEGNATVGDVLLKMTDLGHFESVEEDAYKEKEVGDLKPGEIKNLEWGFVAGDVPMARTSNFRYRVGYDSEGYASYGVAIMSEDEFLRRKDEGVEEPLDLGYFKRDSPLDINISTPDEQPVLGGDDFILEIKFRNVGEGSVKDQVLEEGSVVLDWPEDSLNQKGGCQGKMVEENGNLTLADDLYFHEDETSTISCRFVAPDKVDILEEESFEVYADYRYIIDGMVSVTVAP